MTEKSIAVLPFSNLSGDPENEYFSDGISEEIINALTKISGLKVTARTSSFAFKGKHVDVRDIGQQLSVALLLEGSVRKYKERVRISAQLVRAEDGFYLWSHNYDRELDDLFALQDEISLQIADRVRENLGHLNIQSHLVTPLTKSVPAYDAFLKGRYYELKWTAEDITESIKHYEKSIALDPDYPMPYYGLLQCHGMQAAWGLVNPEEGFQRAGIAFRKAAALNNQIAEYHHAFAVRSMWFTGDYPAAYQQLRKALAVNGDSTYALNSMAGLLTSLGYFEQAMPYINRGIEIDPLSVNHLIDKASLLYFDGNYDEAIEICDKILGMEANWTLAEQIKAASLIMQEKQEPLWDFSELMPAAHKNAYRGLYELRAAGKTDIEIPEKGLPLGFVPWDLCFKIYQGELEVAEKLLKEGVDQLKAQYVNFRIEPLLGPLRVSMTFYKLIEETPLILEQEEDEQAVLKSKPGPAPAPMQHDEVNTILQKLEQLFAIEEPYLDSSLSLKGLAGQVDLHPNKLSWLINEHTGKNFNEYINSYRLEAFKKKALDPDYEHLTLLGLANESGFNSKTVFNAFFKKSTGMTPKKWLKAEKG